ncbi:ATP-binding protein [Geomonas sp. RF6]|uniref:sensor histidine kinase n=1 Tax=Geomonas sp. RF6 TaxID=2897342 RepID=UPI001E447D64|nr:ABC transporter substrate binding protein [Geomonas sp. RF6]UFS70239.1 ATP-binding protein [Geomonas sp. RF6]
MDEAEGGSCMPRAWHLKRRTSSIMLVILTTAFVCLISLSTLCLAQTEKNVLVLNSYSPGFKWTDDTIAGISESLRHSGQRVRIHHEFMDTKRVSDSHYLALLYETYRYKFGQSSFDLIMTSDDDAFDFMVKYRDQLFPNIPVVFCGVNNFDPSRLHGERLFTGVNEAVDLKKTLDLALRLHPKTKEVLVVNDTTTTGRTVHSQLDEIIPAYLSRVNFTLLEDVAMPEILATVQKLEPDALVFYLFFSRDKLGNQFDYDESISLVAHRCPVPVYGVWDFNLGRGIVGGMLTSGYTQGITAGRIAVRVLQGESADNIPVVMTSPNKYMFDYRQMQRFGIKASDLPAQSIVVNRPSNQFTLWRGFVWGGVAVLTLLALAISILVFKMVMKKRMERRLFHLNNELEERVRQRTEELRLNQLALEEQNAVLQQTLSALKVETEERIRVMEELRARDQLLIHQSRMAAMGEMLGNIAHQWRQPLNVLGLCIQELGLAYSVGEFSEQLLETNTRKMMTLLDHLSRTIDDFRSMSTPEREKIRFNVRQVIEKTLSLVSDSFAAQGIRIETDISGEPEVNGYPNEYGQVLLNILMNARDAFLERAVADARITVRAWTEEGRTVATVTDNAGGMDNSILCKAFEPYFTTKEPGKGTGIGLFMSKTIIEKNMGGKLKARNVGGGMEFKISI